MGFRYILAGAALAGLLATAASADDIYKGVRGPTPFQADVRTALSYSNTTTVTNTLILKYWNGNDYGTWAFVGLPYRFFLDSPVHDGFGDASLGAGPRFKAGPVNVLYYAALNFPTGNPKKGGGNERRDIKIGCSATTMTPDKKLEFDVSGEISFTGKNRRNKDPPNESYFGFVAGEEFAKNYRCAVGLTHQNRSDAGHQTNARAVARYTRYKNIHFEIIGDRTIGAHSYPIQTTVTGLARYNFDL